MHQTHASYEQNGREQDQNHKMHLHQENTGVRRFKNSRGQPKTRLESVGKCRDGIKSWRSSKTCQNLKTCGKRHVWIHLGVSYNGDTPKLMVYHRKSHSNWMIWG